MLTEETIREIVAREVQFAQRGIVAEVKANVLAMLQQLATEFAAAQEPLVKELCEQREDLGHVIAAVKDMQTAVGMLCERLDVVMDRPTDPDDWWKG